MTTDRPRLSEHRWRKRALIVAAILSATVAGYLFHRVIRRQWLLTELDAVGARVTCDSTLQQLRRWSLYSSVERMETEVDLTGVQIDEGWLHRHDFLHGLEIEDLSCDNMPGRVLAGLIDAHPLRRLFLFDCAISGVVLDALQECSTLQLLQLDGSTLDDDGLARLPLDQIEILHIQKTSVTSRGLMHLKRCRALRFVTIDRNQLSDDSIDLLASLGTVETVGLSGDDITDQDLMRLLRIPTLTGCSLSGTSTSDEGVSDFMEAIRTQ